MRSLPCGIFNEVELLYYLSVKLGGQGMKTYNRFALIALLISISLMSSTSLSVADSRFNDQGQLAFNSDGTPLPGFDGSGQPVALDPPSIPRPSEIVILGFTTDGNPIYGPVPGADSSPPLQPGFPIPDNRPSYTYSFPDGTTMNIPAGQDANGNYVAVPPPIGGTLVGPNPNPPINVGVGIDSRPYYVYRFSDGTTMEIPAGQDANGNFIAVPPPIGATLVGPSVAAPTPPRRVNADGSRIEADGRYTPPPLFNPDGSVYGGEPVLRIPGATDAAPFGFRQDGTPVPPPLFNQDGTPFVLGTSPIPVPKRIIGAPFGYDSMGTPVPAPLWNPDGTPYVHGVSELPDVPANLRRPIALTDPIAREIVNQEFEAADISAKKTRKGYLLETDDQISYVDKTLKVIATKKGAKPKALTLTVDPNGELFVPTGVNLKGFQLQIKRGDNLIKAIKLR
jgi:hypothetical protein